MLTPETTYAALVVVLALHLLHHRLAKKHISFAEVLTAGVLCVPASSPVPGWVLIAAHGALAALLVVGSLWISKLSPKWERA